MINAMHFFSIGAIQHACFKTFDIILLP